MPSTTPPAHNSGDDREETILLLHEMLTSLKKIAEALELQGLSAILEEARREVDRELG
jgi:hypothetical protein